MLHKDSIKKAIMSKQPDAHNPVALLKINKLEVPGGNVERIFGVTKLRTFSS